MSDMWLFSPSAARAHCTTPRDAALKSWQMPFARCRLQCDQGLTNLAVGNRWQHAIIKSNILFLGNDALLGKPQAPKPELLMYPDKDSSSHK